MLICVCIAHSYLTVALVYPNLDVELPPSPSPQGFSAQKCAANKTSQMWELSPGVKPGDALPTNVKSGAGKTGGCWEITGCSSGSGAAVGCGYGCKALPKPGSTPVKCALNGAWSFNTNGTITSVMDGHCLQLTGGKGSAITVGPCTGKTNQIFKTVAWPTGSGFTVEQNGKFAPRSAHRSAQQCHSQKLVGAEKLSIFVKASRTFGKSLTPRQCVAW